MKINILYFVSKIIVIVLTIVIILLILLFIISGYQCECYYTKNHNKSIQTKYLNIRFEGIKYSGWSINKDKRMEVLVSNIDDVIVPSTLNIYLTSTKDTIKYHSKINYHSLLYDQYRLVGADSLIPSKIYSDNFEFKFQEKIKTKNSINIEFDIDSIGFIKHKKIFISNLIKKTYCVYNLKFRLH